MNFLFYKKVKEEYTFCSGNFNITNEYPNHYCLQYNSGIIGEINDFEVWMPITKAEGLEKLEEIKKEYNSPHPPCEEIEISFDLSQAILKYDEEDFENLVRHFWATTRYVSIHAGLGFFNEPEPSYDLIRSALKFGYKYRVVDKDQFKSLYLMYMLLGEIDSDWINIK